jgi:outer membrane protease
MKIIAVFITLVSIYFACPAPLRADEATNEAPVATAEPAPEAPATDTVEAAPAPEAPVVDTVEAVEPDPETPVAEAEGGFFASLFSAYTFSVAAHFGLLVGQSEELVYKDAAGDSYLSQLLWNMKPLIYYGLKADFSRRQPLEKWGLFVNAAFKSGFPAETGVMEDRDWNDASETPTDFSSHDNYTRGSFLMDISVGGSIPIKQALLIKLYAGFSYMFFAWYGQDGQGEYNSGSTTLYFSGAVINYTQIWNILNGGLSLSYHFSMFSIGAGFRVGKLFSYLAQDDHITNKQQFTDTKKSLGGSGGLMLEPSLEFAFSPDPVLAITLHGGFRFISAFQGTSTMRTTSGAAYPGTTQRTAGNIGAKYHVWDIGLSFTVRF